MPLNQTAPLDLSDFVNAKLEESWHDTSDTGNNLAQLSSGILSIGNLAFRVTGIIQLGGGPLTTSNRWPLEVKGIPVKRAGKKLYFLHAAGWGNGSEKQVGPFVIHLADGSSHIRPIVRGRDLVDWHVSGGQVSTFYPAKQPLTAWLGYNKVSAGSRRFIALFLTTWDNQHRVS